MSHEKAQDENYYGEHQQNVNEAASDSEEKPAKPKEQKKAGD